MGICWSILEWYPAVGLNSMLMVTPAFGCVRIRLKRSAELPDVPPVADSVPGYESTSWVLIMGPAKLPPAVVGALRKESARALALPDVKERLTRLGSERVGNSPDEANKFIRGELEKWAKTVKAAGIKTSD